MPLLIPGNQPPPSWWMLLTANQRQTIIARLRKLGVDATRVDTTKWPS